MILKHQNTARGGGSKKNPPAHQKLKRPGRMRLNEESVERV